MSKRISVGILLLFTALASASAQNGVITILHLNDTHSNLSAMGPRTQALKGTVGGIARAATVIEVTRFQDRDALLLHAGDIFVGDIFFNTTFGVPELRILKHLGCDAMTVGNHEFDLTPAVLYSSLSEAFHGKGFPILSANTVLEAPEVAPLKKYIVPFTIKSVEGTRIGIFGLTTPETNLISQPSPAFIDTNFVQIAAAMVDTLKKLHCPVVILLSHLGLQYDQIVASFVPGIDYVLGGHDHYALEQPVPIVNPLGDTTWIMQAGAFYEDIGKLKFRVENGKAHLVKYRLVHLDSSIPEDPHVAAEVKKLERKIQAVYGPMFTQKIAHARADFPGIADSLLSPGNHDTPAGNLVTDAFRACTNTDVAITAGGSIAQPLHKGPLVGDDVFRMVGYGFNTDNGLGYRLATFGVTGLDLIKGLEFGLSSIELNDEYLIQVSGMSYKYAVDRPAGTRIVDVRIGGEEIDLSKVYTVTTNEYILAILKDFVGPMVGMTVIDPRVLSGVAEYSVVEGYVSAKGVLTPDIEGRVEGILTASPSVRSGSGEQAKVAREYRLEQNFPNPFNPTTVIGYRLSEVSNVTLKVYDILGREVMTLVNGRQSAGNHSVSFNAGRLPSGVYFYRIQAGSFSEMKKMILAK